MDIVFSSAERTSQLENIIIASKNKMHLHELWCQRVVFVTEYNESIFEKNVFP